MIDDKYVKAINDPEYKKCYNKMKNIKAKDMQFYYYINSRSWLMLLIMALLFLIDNGWIGQIACIIFWNYCQGKLAKYQKSGEYAIAVRKRDSEIKRQAKDKEINEIITKFKKERDVK